MSRKVFTAGEVLAAADVNSFLMDQTVMSFAGTAARGSAIPSPTEGMYTHLEDSDRLQFWNGSAWRSPLGLTLVNSTSYTAQSVITLNNVFSDEFDFYLIEVAHTQNGSGNLAFTLVNGVTVAASNWGYNGIAYGGSGTASIITTGAAGGGASVSGFSTIGGNNFLTIKIANPFKTSVTNAIMHYMTTNSGFLGYAFVALGAQLTNTTSYEGLRITNGTGGTTYTGTIRVYGQRNSI